MAGDADVRLWTEARMTDPDTGGQKGVKPERFDLIPAEPLMELARVYGWGATKYDDHNWRKGYNWGWSFASLMRHAWEWWAGKRADPESGLHPLAHVAWHCFALMWYQMESQGKDDRADAWTEEKKTWADATRIGT